MIPPEKWYLFLFFYVDYAVNGNLITDRNKGVTSVLYNHFDLPTDIVVSNTEHTGNIKYTYDANGIKLRKVKTEGSSVTTTDYSGDYTYENGNLKFINQPEGYIEPDGDNYQYVYRLKDIWGNTRITYADANKDGSITTSEIRREQNYYPFGLEHKGYNTALRGVKNNLKTYQGQELTEDLGLNTHEWRYRISDRSIGRFWQIDPLSEDYMYNSTYAFQENKLGMGIELEGAELFGWVQQKLVENTVQNPNGVSAHIMGAAQAIGQNIEGAIDAVTHPIQTAKAVASLTVAAASKGNTTTMMEADAALGTNSMQAANAVVTSVEKGANDLVNGNGVQRGNVIGNIVGGIIGGKGTTTATNAVKTAVKTTSIANKVPKTLARVVPGDIQSSTLGAPGASDVFVTAASDISGLNATQIANKLTIPQSSSGFNVIEFATPKSGISTPINRTNPGFIGGGKTAGGAREFTIPNQTTPVGATVKKVQ